jgi:hypothetical protein
MLQRVFFRLIRSLVTKSVSREMLFTQAIVLRAILIK